MTFLRRRRLRNSLAKYRLAQVQRATWPSTQFAPAPAPPPPVYAPSLPYQQPVVQPNIFSSSAPVRSTNPFHRYSGTDPPVSYQQPVPDNTFQSPAPVRSTNPFHRYSFNDTVFPPVSSETQRTTSPSQTDDPYNSHAMAHRQQGAVLAKYSRASTGNQLSEFAASSSSVTEPHPPPYIEQPLARDH
ncbi:uncharacterized protein BT62DRAFT_928491 [Guyanagaster necrorhizus]|uniref:Uncharacterized protein n=1 Tax=Guyanagaster necrorhizus TaxID=856835 RepID=A0A9P7W0K1_9AGAR|nr:uncharacterized protein BT62DRAFT_928491 [Guyanagaster necrorhizus MCA 3950]KAG7449759.1 hypothetical protein BT62DRAFT_928491 [Guyanagaster necrorhizus MCA 3950]